MRLSYIGGMKQIATLPALALMLPLTLTPVHAEEDGFSLMEEGAKLFFKGIIQEMEPTIDDLRGFAEDVEPALREFVEHVGPALRDLMGKIDNINAYHPPELLPNGDIILRRKSDAEMTPPEGEIDL